MIQVRIELLLHLLNRKLFLKESFNTFSENLLPVVFIGLPTTRKEMHGEVLSTVLAVGPVNKIFV